MYTLSGVVIAGGKAQRMSGVEKGLVLYKGQSMAFWVAQAMEGLVKHVCLNVNRRFSDYQLFGYKLIQDGEAYAERGPLSGLWSALNQASTTHILVAPCDTPNISSAAFAALKVASQAQSERIHCLESGSGLHPLHAIIPVQSGLQSLATFLDGGDRNSVMAYYREHGYDSVLWGVEGELLNVNYQEQIDSSV
ncbi:molybdenum cofactor guanylyltransferase [Marinomonas flavescens]|uniref:molybdenum cofactor guanylyltransferase n=1 Tax=Marinomonas flavescens TaxID=2529379 RepID=UPI001054E90B|nr:molybdenum cofactor guanylyltransferase [Marinomonas flavescens]